jgi:polysaccharide chain length determinant protein (PEP-CTERM system associated)
MSNLKILLMEQAVTLWRHKWIALATCWVVCLVGWGAVMMMPRSYESDARAFVDVNGLLTPLLKGLVVDTNTAQTSDYLRQTLLSRPNLEQVIHLAQLDTGKSDAEKDALIAALSDSVQVRSQGKNLFTISYTNAKPVVAKNIVEGLLTIFAEKAASSSRVEMEKAHKFLDDQIAAYEKQLRDAEQRRADFRKKYADYLSDPSSGMPRLQTLQQTMQQARAAYSQAIITRDSLEAQLKQVPQYRAIGSSAVGADGKSGSAVARLEQAKVVLAALRLKFTDQHPDVIAARNQVADLEKTANEPAAAGAAGATPDIEGKEPNPTYDQIRLKLVDAQTVVPAARQRLDQATADFDKMKAMSVDLPDIDAKAKDIDRDYDVINKNHDELVARRESANLSQAADDQADRTQFRIVDPPQVPLIPSSPNFPLMFSLVLLLGIGAGASLPIALELIRSTFSSVAGLRGMGLPVIGAVTFARRPGATRQLVAGTLGALVASVALLVVFGALLIFNSAV